jgi:hypothetical protein
LKTTGLSLEQAPPLSIPASFFLSIPLGILAAAYVMLTTVAAAFGSPWTPPSVALTHAGTLGVLGLGMMGALYQMTPVVAGTPVPFPRLAHLVHVLMLAGLTGFLWRLVGGTEISMVFAITCFAIALSAFLLPLTWALLRPATRNETVQGMRLAVLSLAALTLLGLVLATGLAGGSFPQQHTMWVQIHLVLGLLGWVGGLIMAVSWQVIPMFYLATLVSPSTRRWLIYLLVTGLVLPLASAMFYPGSDYLSRVEAVAIAALPAALVVWLAHPALVLLGISRRKRKRSDASLLFWKTGLAIALLLIPAALSALPHPDPRWQVLFGWLAIWGWAGLIMHGMLSRIVPFLVWFHRFSARVGFEPVPSMRSLLSQRRIKVGFVLHLASVVAGAATILLHHDMLARITGVLLAATAISLASMLIHVLRICKS